MATSEPKADWARSQAAALAALLIGASLIGASFLPTFRSPSERWTADRAREYQEASLHIQALTHSAVSTTPDTTTLRNEREMQDALARFQQLQQELEAARSQSPSLGMLLRVVGALLAVGGTILYVAWRPTRPESLDHASNRFPSRTT